MTFFRRLQLDRRSVLQRLLLPIAASALAGAAPQAHAANANAPALMLAKVYRPGVPLDGYWVSEKYDGVRGYWDGTQLLTRGGERVTPPGWFTAGWPSVPMDGELWAGRGAFSTAVSTVRQQLPKDAAWRQMLFMVFDLPSQVGSFDERLPVLLQTLDALQSAAPWVKPVAQTKVADHAALQALLLTTLQTGGEGVMLHRGASLYSAQRSDDLLKFKPYEDAEARVIALVPGQGKYLGLMGALLVETPQGQRFKLGTGFSDAQRRNPPQPGAWVTYRFRDVNPSGLPRFASFLRVQEAMQL